MDCSSIALFYNKIKQELVNALTKIGGGLNFIVLFLYIIFLKNKK
jgi:hypothetical protein